MSRVAIVHDYLTQRGGAERVVLSMLKAFPEATIYTTLYDPDNTYPEFAGARIVTSPLNRIPWFRHHHRAALPFLPLAARALTVDADVALVSSSGWAHGFDGSAKRLIYCYSPARWLYQTETYLGGPPRKTWKGIALALLRPGLISWDKRQAARADRYLAISTIAQDRIARTYGLGSTVVPAPHSFDALAPQQPVEELADWAESGYHLTVSRLLPYKNVDKAVAAFAGLTERLVIIGDGPERARIAADLPDNVRMLQALTDEQMRWSYAHATGIVAPSIEDFGLSPIEGGAYGKPTLALRAGGYLDTVLEGVSGEFFDTADAEAIRAAVVANRGHQWDPVAIVAHMEQFSEERFSEHLHREVDDLLNESHTTR